MDLHIRDVIKYTDRDPLTGLVWLDETPIWVLSEGLQGLGKIMASLRDITCILLMEVVHDSEKIHFQFVQEGF